MLLGHCIFDELKSSLNRRQSDFNNDCRKFIKQLTSSISHLSGKVIERAFETHAHTYIILHRGAYFIHPGHNFIDLLICIKVVKVLIEFVEHIVVFKVRKGISGRYVLHFLIKGERIDHLLLSIH